MLPPAVALAATVVVLGPMLGPGYPLRFDLVTVPRPVLGDDALGLGDRLPRAIPLDGATALLGHVLPGALGTQLLAVLALTLAGAGAARLVPGPLAGRLVAAFVAVWNPFVLEQLAIGHVPHLFGYGALTWAAVHAHALGRRGGAASWAGLTAAVALGSLTPGGGALCAVAAGAGLAAGLSPLPRSPSGGRSARSSGHLDLKTVILDEGVGRGEVADGGEAGPGGVRGDGGARGDGGTGWRGWGVVGGVTTVGVLQLPWLVAAVMHPAFAGGAGDPGAGLAEFALRGETGWGRAVDALGLGGMWNADALPPSRGTGLARASTVLVVLLCLAGLPALRRLARIRGPEVAAGAAATAVGYLVAVLGVIPGGDAVLRWLVGAVPGAGLLRDGHRWLALPAIGVAVLAGLAAGSVRSSAARPAVAVLAASLLVATTPDLAWGLLGRLQARHYPAGWAVVREVLDASPDRARVVVLPFQPFRRFAWTGPDAVLDPAPRLLPRQVVVSDALSVGGTRLPEEGLGARAVSAALADGSLDEAELRGVDAGWVLVERGTPGAVPRLPADWSIAYAGPDLLLLRAPDPLPAAPRATAVRTVAVLGAQLAALGLLATAGAVLAGSRLARRSRYAIPRRGR